MKTYTCSNGCFPCSANRSLSNVHNYSLAVGILTSRCYLRTIKLCYIAIIIIFVSQRRKDTLITHSTTHTHTTSICITCDGLVLSEENKQDAEERKWVFISDWKEESEDKCLANISKHLAYYIALFFPFFFFFQVKSTKSTNWKTKLTQKLHRFSTSQSLQHWCGPKSSKASHHRTTYEWRQQRRNLTVFTVGAIPPVLSSLWIALQWDAGGSRVSKKHFLHM